ncbi:unnamed protein product, partial [marine sediment metagenome]
ASYSVVAYKSNTMKTNGTTTNLTEHPSPI